MTATVLRNTASDATAQVHRALNAMGINGGVRVWSQDYTDSVMTFVERYAVDPQKVLEALTGLPEATAVRQHERFTVVTF